MSIDVIEELSIAPVDLIFMHRLNLLIKFLQPLTGQRHTSRPQLFWFGHPCERLVFFIVLQLTHHIFHCPHQVVAIIFGSTCNFSSTPDCSLDTFTIERYTRCISCADPNADTVPPVPLPLSLRAIHSPSIFLFVLNLVFNLVLRNLHLCHLELCFFFGAADEVQMYPLPS